MIVILGVRDAWDLVRKIIGLIQPCISVMARRWTAFFCVWIIIATKCKTKTDVTLKLSFKRHWSHRWTPLECINGNYFKSVLFATISVFARLSFLPLVQSTWVVSITSKYFKHLPRQNAITTIDFAPAGIFCGAHIMLAMTAIRLLVCIKCGRNYYKLRWTQLWRTTLKSTDFITKGNLRGIREILRIP